MSTILTWISAHASWVGLGLSEILALVPSIKSNSVLQLVASSMKSLFDAISAAINPPAA